jgi:acyl-CoA reductase-like NAD-dependent aldehyde dehydrogenase
VIVVEELAGAVTAGLVEAAGRLRVGDPLDPATEVGPLASAESLGEIDAAVAAEGTERLCGGPVDVPGLAGPFLAPTVLRATRPTASPDSSGAPPAHVAPAPPGPVVTVVAARDDAEAAALADGTGAPAVSVWAGSPATGERVARELRAELTWVGEHGHAIAAAAPVRLARHVRVRRLASQRGGLRSVRWLPYDPALVRARVAAARLAHGRDSERWDALRSGAVPIARTLAGRLTRRTGPGRTGRGL